MQNLGCVFEKYRQKKEEYGCAKMERLLGGEEFRAVAALDDGDEIRGADWRRIERRLLGGVWMGGAGRRRVARGRG